jgi:GxxExxY protein
MSWDYEVSNSEGRSNCPWSTRGVKLDCHFFMDIVVTDQLVLELKTVEKIMPIHQAQLLTYMKLSAKRLGLLLNFNVSLLKDGIKRLIL